jgi:hypothetical protein
MSATIQAEPAHNIAPHAGPKARSFDILLHFIVTILAPMFLTASGGDIHLARATALETVNAYRARTQTDLIAVAQIIAFGLGALGSLSLSLTDDLSLSMVLRLRGNANACHRSAEQNRRALTQSGSGDAAPHQPGTRDAEEKPFTADDLAFEATVLANLADLQKRLAETRPPQNVGESAAPPALRSAPALTTQQPQRQPIHAPKMNERVADGTPRVVHPPRAERKPGSLRAAALASSASNLIEDVANTYFHAGQTTPRPFPPHAGITL